MNQTQRILCKLKDTHNIMVGAATKMLERGEELKATKERVDDVMRTSELFMFKALPWYSRIYHKSKRVFFCQFWWCSSCINNCLQCCFFDDKDDSQMS